MPASVPRAAPVVDPAFEAFFREHLGPMVRVGRLITGSAAVGEEIAQEAFCAVFERWSTLDEPVGYLYRSVVNRARSYLRHEGVAQRGAVRLGVTPTHVEQVHADHALRQAVDGLNDRQRAAVVLKFWADLPEREIASILECRPGTVKSMLSRAMSELRKVVAP
jgi:RNA polymerase sigma factor (sigma-70 family)